MWKLIAFLVSKEPIANYLIKRSQRTPYFNLDGYMNRWWLFNGYESDLMLPDSSRHTCKKYQWLPSIRVHHILREDRGRDLHDHPWDARTIILKGWYEEERIVWCKDVAIATTSTIRQKGDTATLELGEFHSINRVSEGGVYTLFFTWKYQGTWGFYVNGRKINHKDYVNEGAP